MDTDMPDTLDSLQKDPEFANFSPQQKRQIIKSALSRDPEFGSFTSQQKAHIQNTILSRYPDKTQPAPAKTKPAPRPDFRAWKDEGIPPAPKMKPSPTASMTAEEYEKKYGKVKPTPGKYKPGGQLNKSLSDTDYIAKQEAANKKAYEKEGMLDRYGSFLGHMLAVPTPLNTRVQNEQIMRKFSGQGGPQPGGFLQNAFPGLMGQAQQAGGAKKAIAEVASQLITPTNAAIAAFLPEIGVGKYALWAKRAATLYFTQGMARGTLNAAQDKELLKRDPHQYAMKVLLNGALALTAAHGATKELKGFVEKLHEAEANRQIDAVSGAFDKAKQEAETRRKTSEARARQKAIAKVQRPKPTPTPTLQPAKPLTVRQEYAQKGGTFDKQGNVLKPELYLKIQDARTKPVASKSTPASETAVSKPSSLAQSRKGAEGTQVPTPPKPSTETKVEAKPTLKTNLTIKTPEEQAKTEAKQEKLRKEFVGEEKANAVEEKMQQPEGSIGEHQGNEGERPQPGSERRSGVGDAAESVRKPTQEQGKEEVVPGSKGYIGPKSVLPGARLHDEIPRAQLWQTPNGLWQVRDDNGSIVYKTNSKGDAVRKFNGYNPVAEITPKKSEGKREEGREEPAPAATKPVTSVTPKPITPIETAEKTEGTKTTGIAQRVHEARAAAGVQGRILPGQGVTPQQMLDRGNYLIDHDKVDPVAHLAMMEKRGMAVEGDDMAVLRAQHFRYSKLSDQAYQAWKADPTNAAKKAAYEEAYNTQTKWAERVKPYQTESHKIFTAQQGEQELDTGSFSSMREAYESSAKRKATPAEFAHTERLTERVNNLSAQVRELTGKLDKALEARQERTAKTTPGGKSKTEAPSGREELSRYFAKKFGTRTPTKETAERGALGGGTKKPRFTPAEVQMLWRYAKNHYISKGADYTSTINGVATDLGLNADWVKDAFEGKREVKRMSEAMYEKMRQQRQAQNEAKAWVQFANMSRGRRAWLMTTNFPRGIKVFGHGAVGMVTHAGPNIFRPSDWDVYWHNEIRSFKYWRDPILHERMMQTIEKHPNFPMWTRAGLAIDPNRLYDDYQIYGKYIGKAGAGGNRGMDALKNYRLEYAEKLWNGLPKSLQDEPDMPAVIADWVNHASGVGHLGGGPIAGALHETMFAGSLEAARWARILGDPIKTIKTKFNPNATPAEKWAANLRIRKAAELTTVLLGTLAVNHHLLQATGQKVDIGLDPRKADFLRFKWNDHTYDVTGNMLAPVKFLATVLNLADAYRKPAGYEMGRSKHELLSGDVGFYGEGKLAPLYGGGLDILLREDPLGRPLPFSPKPGTQAHPKYSWGEYGWDQMPIPAAGTAREVYDALRQSGSDSATSKFLIAAVTAAKTFPLEFVGARVSPNPKPDRPPTTSGKIPSFQQQFSTSFAK